MPTITDIDDDNSYNTVQIESQSWMAENLKTTTYHNGEPIPIVTNDDDWSNLTTGAYAWHGNDFSWKDPYGVLYNQFTEITENKAILVSDIVYNLGLQPPTLFTKLFKNTTANNVHILLFQKFQLEYTCC